MKAAYTLRTTGKSRRIVPEGGPEISLPEVEIVAILADEPLDSAEAHHVRVEVEGDGFFYLTSTWHYGDGEIANGHACLLVREINALDAGDNVVRTRTAPATTGGMCRPTISGGSLNAIDGEPVYAIRPRLKSEAGKSTFAVAK